MHFSWHWFKIPLNSISFQRLIIFFIFVLIFFYISLLDKFERSCFLHFLWHWLKISLNLISFQYIWKKIENIFTFLLWFNISLFDKLYAIVLFAFFMTLIKLRGAALEHCLTQVHMIYNLGYKIICIFHIHLICSNVQYIGLYIIIYDTQEDQATFSTLTNLLYK